MKLISCTNFVIEQLKTKQSASKLKEVVNSYANFLQQPLTLSMFIPCNENGKVLEDPDSKNYNEETNGWFNASNEYQQAKEKIVFENVSKAQYVFYLQMYSTIEDLSRITNTLTPLTITQNAVETYKLK